MNIAFRDVKLRLVSSFTMPERKWDTNKKEWVPTGETKRIFEHVLQDDVKEILEIKSPNDYSEFEGQNVEVVLDIANDRFNRGAFQVKLVEIAKI